MKRRARHLQRASIETRKGAGTHSVHGVQRSAFLQQTNPICIPEYGGGSGRIDGRTNLVDAAKQFMVKTNIPFDGFAIPFAFYKQRAMHLISVAQEGRWDSYQESMRSYRKDVMEQKKFAEYLHREAVHRTKGSHLNEAREWLRVLCKSLERLESLDEQFSLYFDGGLLEEYISDMATGRLVWS
ncbi:hypothetical protein M422DRAFT_243105 [Sphaerobolus stellatus SS14]|nr:hypothetical protein M422DRAFT_243105 [Sphaerobolus stellatus SS14]